ncbi:MAG: hypothetical protein ACRC8S_05165 [Fimbriiglobus sp.]
MKRDESESRRRSRDDDDRPPVDRAAALRRAMPPAIAMMTVGVINTGLGLLVAVMGLVVGGMNMGVPEGVIGVFSALAGMVGFAGGLNLMRLDGFGLVRTGSILAMIPCLSLCLIFGLPIGVWALVTATSPDVRAAFRDRRGKDDR